MPGRRSRGSTRSMPFVTGDSSPKAAVYVVTLRSCLVEADEDDANQDEQAAEELGFRRHLAE